LDGKVAITLIGIAIWDLIVAKVPTHWVGPSSCTYTNVKNDGAGEQGRENNYE